MCQINSAFCLKKQNENLLSVKRSSTYNVTVLCIVCNKGNFHLYVENELFLPVIIRERRSGRQKREMVFQKKGLQFKEEGNIII